jgi:mRNA interferase MazF
VVVQANRWLQDHPSVTLCPLTSTLVEAPLVRLIVQPTPGNGLHKPSQLMIDKLFTVPMAAIGEVIGVLEPAAMANLDLALRGWLELGTILRLSSYALALADPLNEGFTSMACLHHRSSGRSPRASWCAARWGRSSLAMGAGGLGPRLPHPERTGGGS